MIIKVYPTDKPGEYAPRDVIAGQVEFLPQGGTALYRRDDGVYETRHYDCAINVVTGEDGLRELLQFELPEGIQLRLNPPHHDDPSILIWAGEAADSAADTGG